MAERPRREKVVTAADMKRKADRENLKAAREGKKSRLDMLEIEAEDNVYDVMDQDEYEDLVRKRRQREDFVVDDEGLGYYDDGEEHAYEREEEQQQRNLAEKEARKKVGVSTISAEALKKARRLGQLSEGAKGGSGKEGLFKYVQRAGASVGPATAGGKSSKASSSKDRDEEVGPSSKKAVGKGGDAGKGGAFEEELESQLNDLMASASTGGGGGGSAPVRRPMASAGGGGSGLRPIARPRPMLNGPRRLNPSQQQQVRRPIPSSSAPSMDGGAGYHDDFDMRDDGGVPMDFDDAAVPDENKEEEGNKGTAAAPAASVKAKSRFQRTKKAIEAAMPAPMGGRPAAPEPIDPVAGVKVDGLEAARGGDEDEEEDPYSISSVAAASTAPGTAAAANAVNWEAVVKAEEDGTPYIPFFWMDAHEQNGVIYLFGKVAAEEGRFVSAACCVHGVQNSLLVLPKRTGNAGPDGKDVRYGMGEVYKEIHDLLVPSVIPRDVGQGFKCKPVKRKYAFELEDVPREETEYLKVVYGANHGLPSPERCEAGGRFFERVFGARTTALERFLLKRQLMGPCWLKIHSPAPASNSATIAKLEFTVGDPKLVQKLADPPASPPMVVMSLALKTVVNPSSQLHEVVAISTMAHTSVNCDGPTETSPKHIKQVTAVRPLGTSAGSGYPAVFPHDIAREVEGQAKKTRIQTQGNERALLSWFFQRLQTEDPDVVVGHNLLGFELEVLLSRATALKVSVWHKIGRLRRSKFPNPKGLARVRPHSSTYFSLSLSSVYTCLSIPPSIHLLIFSSIYAYISLSSQPTHPPTSPKSKDINLFGLTAGRLMADTYLTAREHLRETTYSLTHLATTQLHLPHPRYVLLPTHQNSIHLPTYPLQGPNRPHASAFLLLLLQAHCQPCPAHRL